MTVRPLPTPVPERRPAARLRVLVDEAHQQAWSVRPEVAAAMAPAHPGDSSYATAARLLAERDLEVGVLVAGRLDTEVLATVDVVVIAHPSDPRWEATTGVGSPVYDDEERAALASFVAAGGGLVVLAETEQDKYGTNLDALLAPFGLGVVNATVQDYEEHHRAPTWIFGTSTATPEAADLFDGVEKACFYRAGVVTAAGAGAALAAVSGPTAAPARAGLVATARHVKGRVVLFADSDLFGDDCIGEFDHARLWCNAVYWVALPRFASPAPVPGSRVLARRHWADLLGAVESLRSRQADDGSVDLDAHARDDVAGDVARIEAALAGLAPAFPHDADYLGAVTADLRRWLDGGCGRPDFGASLAAFRPELTRADGVEHLVVFPMYAPNGTTGTRFEALLVRGPWPEWLAVVEATTHPNAKFVPVHLLGHTSGYANECAVLFPETVAVAGRAANTFGGIFCDREAGRFREVTGAAVAAVGLRLPPQAQALLADEALARDTFLLWDLVHDRAHSRGDLPFDPFMIRQRLPYWMYALEELRCDLTAFVEAGEMAADLPFARHVQDAVLLDRMLRFPVTGGRVRNYDGLGGQILFGHLHARGVVRWTDNTLVVDWRALPAAVADLLEEIRTLYRRGIDSSRVRYWVEAHDLVSRYVPPAMGSRWTPEGRADAPAEDDPKAWVDRVLPDEFPLNLFYRSLQARMQPVFEARSAAFAAAATGETA